METLEASHHNEVEKNGDSCTEPGPGVWETTQLDSAIGDLHRNDVVSSTVGPALEEDTEGRLSTSGSVVKAAKKARRPRKPRVVPTTRVYRGTFIHSTSPNSLEVLQDWLIGVDNGKIIFSESSNNYQSLLVQHKLSDFEKECIISLEDGTFMIPGFVDAHTHVVPYLVAGLVMDSRDGKDNGLVERRRKKLNLIANDKIAVEMFNRFIQQSLQNGITCASYNGSTIESAARLLTDALVRCKQRSHIGLEIFYGDNRDDTHLFQMMKAKDVIQHIIRKKSDLVQPCLLLSKPLPEWMEMKVVEMAKELNLPIKQIVRSDCKICKAQTVIGDFPEDQLEDALKNWIQLGKKHMIRYHKKCGLFDVKSILVNCSTCSNSDLKMIADSGSGIVHCPSATLLNCTFSSLVRFFHFNIPVGLGTDINTSHCVSMLETIRRALQCIVLNRKLPQPTSPKRRGESKRNASELNDSDCRISSEEKKEDDSDDESDGLEFAPNEIIDISVTRLFHMATLGGATVLGLGDKIGNFEVGKEFDAIHIDPFNPSSRFVVLRNQDSILEVLEKFLFLGDDRNIVKVFVKGERVV